MIFKKKREEPEIPNKKKDETIKKFLDEVEASEEEIKAKAKDLSPVGLVYNWYCGNSRKEFINPYGSESKTLYGELGNGDRIELNDIYEIDFATSITKSTYSRREHLPIYFINLVHQPPFHQIKNTTEYVRWTNWWVAELDYPNKQYIWWLRATAPAIAAAITAEESQ